MTPPLSPARPEGRVEDLQGYLADKKTHSLRTLQPEYAWGLLVVLGGGGPRWGGAVSYERGTPV